MLAQSKVFLGIAAILGLSWGGQKIYREMRLKFLKGHVKELNRQLVECYQLKASVQVTDKLQQCLLKAKENHRKVKNCHKKYGKE